MAAGKRNVVDVRGEEPVSAPRGPRRKPAPVVITRLPVVRCAVCGQTMAHQPGKAAAVLTDHYKAVHGADR